MYRKVCHLPMKNRQQQTARNTVEICFILAESTRLLLRTVLDWIVPSLPDTVSAANTPALHWHTLKANSGVSRYLYRCCSALLGLPELWLTCGHPVDVIRTSRDNNLLLPHLKNLKKFCHTKLEH